jgi:hypothetical protein
VISFEQFDLTNNNLECLVNGCSSSPCQNDGQCISSIVNCTSTTCPISCICSNGTTGIYCEQQDVSCLNGGTCWTNETTDISYCHCPANTTGSR